jgi:uncharacterized repeat protein (TIGR04138 family)
VSDDAAQWRPDGMCEMSSHETQIDLKEIMDRAGGFSPMCFPFIREGLAHTVEMVHGNRDDESMLELGLSDESRHVSGHELSVGLKDYAIDRYGMMAKSVLNKWGISHTLDFGKIIFAMVEAGLMRTTEEDQLEDFDGVYDFDDVFPDPTRHTRPVQASS